MKYDENCLNHRLQRRLRQGGYAVQSFRLSLMPIKILSASANMNKVPKDNCNYIQYVRIQY